MIGWIPLHSPLVHHFCAKPINWAGASGSVSYPLWQFWEIISLFYRLMYLTIEDA